MCKATEWQVSRFPVPVDSVRLCRFLWQRAFSIFFHLSKQTCYHLMCGIFKKRDDWRRWICKGVLSVKALYAHICPETRGYTAICPKILLSGVFFSYSKISVYDSRSEFSVVEFRESAPSLGFPQWSDYLFLQLELHFDVGRVFGTCCLCSAGNIIGRSRHWWINGWGRSFQSKSLQLPPLHKVCMRQ